MRISVLGDSISTFSGWNPPGYKIFYDHKQQLRNGLRSAEDTWWSQVITYLGGELCVNNSFSGSRVSGGKFPAAHTFERINALSNECQPDFILIYLGLNDFGYHVPVRKKAFWLRKHNPLFFYDAYDLMLRNIKRRYPQARILCASVLESRVRNAPQWRFEQGFSGGDPLRKYNAVIRKACRKKNVMFVDLQHSGMIQTYETLDGAHPTARGHAEIAQCWIQALSRTFGR